MKFTKCSATNVAVSVALLMAGLVGSPATAEDPAQEFEQLKEIEPPEGYVLHDIKECPEGTRTLALAVPDPRERDLYHTRGRRVLLLLNEEGEPELEIGPETADLEIYSLATANWLRDGESFVFVATPAWDFDSEKAELDRLREELSATDLEQEPERWRDLNERLRELTDKIDERLTDLLKSTTLFKYDAAADEVEPLWDINERVWDVDVDGEGLIHVGLRNNGVYVLTREGEHVMSHTIPDVPEDSSDRRRLDASSQTVWATMWINVERQSGAGEVWDTIGTFVVRLHYGGEEPGEWEAKVDDALLVDVSGPAILYGASDTYDEESQGYFVYDVETNERTRVLANLDVLGDSSSGKMEEVGPTLAPDGSAVRYPAVHYRYRGDETRDELEIKEWENTALYEYTLPE